MTELNRDHLQILPPVGYLDLLWLLKECKYVLTDSGGIQEEATAPVFNKFVFVLRETTDRQEAVDTGFAMVTGTNSQKVLAQVTTNRDKVLNLSKRSSPYGDEMLPRKLSILLR